MSSSLDMRVAARVPIERLHALRRRSQLVGRVSGLRSKATMTALVAAEAFLGQRDHPAAGSAVPVRVTALGGRPVWLRPRSYDRAALEFLHYGHHLPPAELGGPVRQIAVYGANIGLLLGDLAARYPAARLLGVEPDQDNAALARRNLAHLGTRCTLAEAAAWYRDETLTLTWKPDAWGQIVTDLPHHTGNSARTVQLDAVDAGKLLGEFSSQEPVDYLLINIGSPWYQLLRHGEWTRNVRCLRIEIQDHYDEAIPLLEALGYQAWLQRLTWGAFATGIRFS